MSLCRRFFCCSGTIKKPKVYVLQLQNNKYYVGESINPKKRIQDHFKGRGSVWTKINQPVKSLEPLTRPQDDLWELTETLRRMNFHGVDNVRGSLFTQPKPLSKEQKVMTGQLFCELNGFCRRCGGSGHFINQCPSDNVASWVDNFGGSLTFDEHKTCIGCGNGLSEKYHNYCSKCYSLKPRTYAK
tara:strand:+ start:708 stop:1265 length:558 start_codon:yes stop_codon:yes gene_type:complete